MALVYCKECGREVSDKAKFCPQCGFTFKIKGRGFAITSMVLGIIAFTYSLPLFIRTLTLMTDTLI
ncbi:MAG: zinc ribbon domain-containing protein, partial [Clostridia bacterium]|nr:zinc ribbon domain-containing protein [Clostridia bacterium]